MLNIAWMGRSFGANKEPKNAMRHGRKLLLVLMLLSVGACSAETSKDVSGKPAASNSIRNRKEQWKMRAFWEVKEALSRSRLVTASETWS